MANDLSRQLCELCGIEYEKTIPFVLTNENGIVQSYKKQTLDFTNGANFVRLFDLKTNNHTNVLTIAYVITNNHAICSTEEFLYYLLCELRADKGFAISNVKQSIRGAEWVYE